MHRLKPPESKAHRIMYVAEGPPALYIRMVMSYIFQGASSTNDPNLPWCRRALTSAPTLIARRQKYSLDVLYLEITEMKKIILAAAVAMVVGTPLAFAATSGNTSGSEPTSRHCTYQGENWDLCHQDRHKDGGRGK